MSLNLIINQLAALLARLRNRHFFFLDLFFLALIPLLALWFRTDYAFNDVRYSSDIIWFTILSVPVWMGVLVWSGLYTRNWKYFSLGELNTILKAVLLATLINLVLLFLLYRPTQLISPELPRSLPFIVALLATAAIIGTRYSVRGTDRLRRQLQFSGRAHKNVIVYGAGETGVLIVREMQMNPQRALNPVGFLDDDKSKRGTLILGIPVIGGREAIEEISPEYHASEVIIAMPTAPGKTIREIAAQCKRYQLNVKIVPGMLELVDGSVTVSKLRDVEIDDLLRREPVEIESAAVIDLLHAKHVLVTGAGGSIGSELCRQIARAAPAEIILLGHGENSIFEIRNELTRTFPQVALTSLIADVRDVQRIESVMSRHRPQLVFHAAAHKHVSLMETNIEDAVANNVVGTRVILDAAIKHGVEAFVMISTDKAVNPASVMGATKRVAEIYVHARALETGSRCAAVRFGNVLGSRGSVVPLFKQQIANGGPVQVTHPEVKRFFMTIPEAVQLVLQAATLGKGGEIFALDMGEPIRIVDLARDLIRLSGLEEGRDIDIEFTGLRPGEKLYEELFVPGEAYERTQREKIFVARNGARPSAREYARLYGEIDKLVAAAQAGNSQWTSAQLGVIVPEYSPSSAAS